MKITFQVKVPEGTPADAKLFIAGDAEKFGPWKADALEMEKADDGTYVVSAQLPKDKPVEYKITRGSWETVEKNADGSEMANRSLTPTRDAKVEITVAAWADKAAAPAEKKSTRTGDIREHSKFHSKNLNNDRDLIVWLPPGYERNPDQRYPVLYMHDGQNLFDDATSFAGEWKADETAAELIAAKKIEPVIIVGIGNTPRRTDEYTLTRSPTNNAGGKGEAYMKFVVQEVKPFVDSHYRTKTARDDTAVGGSSLGGTISLELARAHPEIFGKCAALSPALWWNDNELPRRLEKDHAWMKHCRIWADTGTREGNEAERYVAGVKQLETLLQDSGGEYNVTIVEGAIHRESAWSERFGQVLEFLFPYNREK